MNMECDEVVPHEADACPKCCGRVFHPLQSWIPPHRSEITIDELSRRSIAMIDQLYDMQRRMEEMMQEVQEEPVKAEDCHVCI